MAMALSEEEIEEQLLNSDLLSSGAVEGNLCGMSTEEKKDLLKGITQSKEEFTSEGHPNMTPKLDNASFPSLPTPGKTNSRKSLKLPRRTSSGTKTDTENVSVKCISLLDDDEDDVQTTKFMLPFFINDNAPPLKMPERPLFESNNPYYVREGENPESGLKRMFTHHLAWKTTYLNEMNKLKLKKLGLDQDLEEGPDVIEHNNSQIDDIYDFKSDSLVQVSKVYTGAKKKQPILKNDNDSQGSNKSIQRRSSRDSDCQEAESIQKPEDPKQGDFIPVRRKTKCNRKQLYKSTQEEQPDVSFDFNNSWDAQSGAWKGGSPSTPLNNQSRPRRFLPKTPVEEKVQCPICQRDFGKSKVETHAATCEGYEGLPMDVEESN